MTELDGWLSLGAHLPPKEKRGLILVDPPFELENEYQRLADGLNKAYRRFSTGTYCLWYPLKKAHRSRISTSGCNPSIFRRCCAQNFP